MDTEVDGFRHRQPLPRQTAMHAHPQGQLFGNQRGLLSLHTPEVRLVVPAHCAVWVPPRLAHGVSSFGPYDGWSLYWAEALCQHLPDTLTVLTVSPLLKHACQRALDVLENPQAAVPTGHLPRVLALIADEISLCPQPSLALPMPASPRLAALANALSLLPVNQFQLPVLAKNHGFSSRTLMRQFREQTGLSPSQWHTRARLFYSMELLADGASVTTAALECGYDTVSAFIAAFKRQCGVTPGSLLERE